MAIIVSLSGRHTDDRYTTGMYAAPDHPITRTNPAPWLIEEIRVELDPVCVWIRNEHSMWFRADQCLIGEEEELREMMEKAEMKKRLETFVITTL